MSVITVCGGGSLGTTCASIFLSEGHVVNMLTGHPEKWSSTIFTTDENNNTFGGKLNIVTDNPKDIISSSKIILLCLPGPQIPGMLTLIKPYLNEFNIVGSVVSSSGFFFSAHEILPSSIPLFGFSRVPYICRVKEYGKNSFLLGYKKSLTVAIENYDDPVTLSKELSTLFKTRVNIANHYLEVSLSNSNPLLHTSRLYCLLKNREKDGFDSLPYFYSDWDDETSDLLLKMDGEFMELVERLKISKESILPLTEYYEVDNITSFTHKIKSIPAFKTIKAPFYLKEDKWYADLNSRYFIEDFEYGLKFIFELIRKNGINAPNISKVYTWGIGLLHQLNN